MVVKNPARPAIIEWRRFACFFSTVVLVGPGHGRDLAYPDRVRVSAAGLIHPPKHRIGRRCPPLSETIVEERRSGPGAFRINDKPTGLARNSLTRGRCARYPEWAAANRTSSFFVDRHLRCVEPIDFASTVGPEQPKRAIWSGGQAHVLATGREAEGSFNVLRSRGAGWLG